MNETQLLLFLSQLIITILITIVILNVLERLTEWYFPVALIFE